MILPGLTVDQVLVATSERFGVSVEAIMGISRETRVTYARHVAMTVMKSTMRISHTEIAKFFGRERSSVIAAVRRKSLSRAQDVVADVASIKDRLGSVLGGLEKAS